MKEAQKQCGTTLKQINATTTTDLSVLIFIR